MVKPTLLKVNWKLYYDDSSPQYFSFRIYTGNVAYQMKRGPRTITSGPVPKLTNEKKETAGQARLGWLQCHLLECRMFFVDWEYGAQTFPAPRCHFKAIDDRNLYIFSKDQIMTRRANPASPSVKVQS
jgi:hypothetical protein